MFTGDPTETLGQQVFQSFGLSPDTAALAYATVGSIPAAGALASTAADAVATSLTGKAATVTGSGTAGVMPVTSEGLANSVSGARLNMQLSAEQAAGVSAPTSITGYSNHAIAQIAGRDGGIGVNQAAVNDAFSNPTAVQYVPSSLGPTFKYIGQNATVVVNPQGNVVTTWGTSAAGVAK
jgi:filamentous hemagglutinin